MLVQHPESLMEKAAFQSVSTGPEATGPEGPGRGRGGGLCQHWAREDPGLAGVFWDVLHEAPLA